jgi:D-serine deaminase-like pyridoxal phosphate-dependent protein
VLLWLVAMADAQSSIKQPAAAAATLRRALQIMIQIETSAEASAAAQRTQRAGTQEQEAQDAAAREAAGGEQTGPAAESPRARLLAEVRRDTPVPVALLGFE